MSKVASIFTGGFIHNIPIVLIYQVLGGQSAIKEVMDFHITAEIKGYNPAGGYAVEKNA